MNFVELVPRFFVSFSPLDVVTLIFLTQLFSPWLFFFISFHFLGLVSSSIFVVLYRCICIFVSVCSYTSFFTFVSFVHPLSKLHCIAHSLPSLHLDESVLLHLLLFSFLAEEMECDDAPIQRKLVSLWTEEQITYFHWIYINIFINTYS